MKEFLVGSLFGAFIAGLGIAVLVTGLLVLMQSDGRASLSRAEKVLKGGRTHLGLAIAIRGLTIGSIATFRDLPDLTIKFLSDFDDRISFLREHWRTESSPAAEIDELKSLVDKCRLLQNGLRDASTSTEWAAQVIRLETMKDRAIKSLSSTTRTQSSS